MDNQKSHTNKDLFITAKEHFLPKKIIDLAKTGSISQRLRYILSVDILTVNQMCDRCKVTEHDVIYFLFKYEHNLNIYTYFNHNRYYFTTSKKKTKFI